MIFKLLSTFTASSFSGLWANRNSSGLLRHWPRSWHGEKCHVDQPPLSLSLFPILRLWIVRLSSVPRPSILANRHMLKDLWNTTVPRVSFSIFPKRHLFRNSQTLFTCSSREDNHPVCTKHNIYLGATISEMHIDSFDGLSFSYASDLFVFFIAQINSHIIIVIFDYPTSKLRILNLLLIIVFSILLILEYETTFELKLITVRSDNDII